ncbi:type II toxin-antitoxin system HicA family toxin [Geoglobus acetivorans]|uniref:Type II toxin-antitoxin system HicA family toxin n=1 Tax=Geoglobus acetivorans TaxID=565033 RepID=A0ABZ3H2P0_GEOAI|nr:type II toxin-antitoxin system HicA family toxin [Geoglobus acetivorans]
MRLPLIKARDFLKFLEWLGFKPVRMKGSHVRLKSEDGRVTTIPVHGNSEIPKGLLRKIIREDLQMSMEEFVEKYNEFKKR